MTIFYRAIFGVALAALLVGCSSSSTAPTPTAAPLMHFYFSDDTVSVFIYGLPLTAASVSTGTITAANGPSGLKIGATGNLYVANFANGSAQVFNAPLSATSVPSATITGLNQPEDVAVNAAGTLYVAASGSNSIAVFNPPLTNASTPAFSITTGVAHPFGLAFDASGHLYSENSANITEYSPPFSGASAPVATFGGNISSYGLVFGATGTLYASNGHLVDVFVPPFANGSTKSYSITLPSGDSTYYLAFDSSGNLYVSGFSGKVYVYTPPFSAASVPSVTLPATTAFGIAIGP